MGVPDFYKLVVVFLYTCCCGFLAEVSFRTLAIVVVVDDDFWLRGFLYACSSLFLVVVVFCTLTVVVDFWQ